MYVHFDIFYESVSLTEIWAFKSLIFTKCTRNSKLFQKFWLKLMASTMNIENDEVVLNLLDSSFLQEIISFNFCAFIRD